MPIALVQHSYPTLRSPPLSFSITTVDICKCIISNLSFPLIRSPISSLYHTMFSTRIINPNILNHHTISKTIRKDNQIRQYNTIHMIWFPRDSNHHKNNTFSLPLISSEFISLFIKPCHDIMNRPNKINYKYNRPKYDFPTIWVKRNTKLTCVSKSH